MCIPTMQSCCFCIAPIICQVNLYQPTVLHLFHEKMFSKSKNKLQQYDSHRRANQMWFNEIVLRDGEAAPLFSVPCAFSAVYFRSAYSTFENQVQLPFCYFFLTDFKEART